MSNLCDKNSYSNLNGSSTDYFVDEKKYLIASVGDMPYDVAEELEEYTLAKEVGEDYELSEVAQFYVDLAN